MMKSSTRSFTVLLAAAILAGCATTTQRNALHPGARDHLDVVDVQFTIPQYEINAETQAPVAGYVIGGIVGGLVNTAIANERTEEATALLQPIRNQLIDYDYTGVLESKIVSELDAIEWFNLADVTLKRNMQENRFEITMEQSDASAIAFIDAAYQLSPNFDEVKTSVSAIMFPLAESLYPFRKSEPKLYEEGFDENTNIYRNTFEAVTQVASGEDKEANATSLSAPDSTIVLDALEKNAVEIARRIAEDLVHAGVDAE